MIFLTERMCAASAHKTGNDKKERSVMAMTTRECYTQMGADYDEVLNRLYSEEMIREEIVQEKVISLIEENAVQPE